MVPSRDHEGDPALLSLEISSPNPMYNFCGEILGPTLEEFRRLKPQLYPLDEAPQDSKPAQWWACLTGGELSLYYAQASSPLKTFALRDIGLLESRSTDCGFALVQSQTRSFHFQAPSRAHARRWMFAIDSQMQRRVQLDPVNPPTLAALVAFWRSGSGVDTHSVRRLPMVSQDQEAHRSHLLRALQRARPGALEKWLLFLGNRWI